MSFKRENVPESDKALGPDRDITHRDFSLEKMESLRPAMSCAQYRSEESRLRIRISPA
jgi:hypothetical protein